MQSEPSTDDARIHAAAKAIIELRAIAEAAPLGVAACWDRPLPRTSQRRAAQAALQPGIMSALIVGGNRSSKTTVGAMIAVAYALGRDHPAVQSWAAINRLDIGVIQPGPGIVCASALTTGDSNMIQRPKVEEFAPISGTWRNRHGQGTAKLTFPGGGQILFKSHDAGARRYQGAAWDLFWADEEHDEPVYNEARMRLVDRGGRSILTMTPLKGLSWVWSRFVDQPEPGTVYVSLHSRDNPHIPQDYLDALLKSYGSHERAARESGEFTALEGRVYDDWRRALHVVPSREVSDEWTRYAALDFGTRNPFACLIAAVDPADDTIHILAEHYRAEWTIRQHADAMRAMFELHGQPELIIADPEDKASRLTLATEHDLPTVKAKKAVRAGISAVAERLQPDAEGRPHLLIHDRCGNLIREMEGYVWDTRRSKADQPDKPLKKDDHAMDALRYLVYYLRSSTFETG